MILGVTGTRHVHKIGKRRIEKLSLFFKANDISELHYGDCTGWDDLAWSLASIAGVKSISHPPCDIRYRAATTPDVAMPPKPYLYRNKDIVDACNFLIAAPDGPEVTRNGTWSTIRYAKKVGVRGVVWM